MPCRHLVSQQATCKNSYIELCWQQATDTSVNLAKHAYVHLSVSDITSVLEVDQQCVEAPLWPILLLLWRWFACKWPPGGAGLTQPSASGLTAASAPASAELPRSGAECDWSELSTPSHRQSFYGCICWASPRGVIFFMSQ